jgi:flagellar hook-associated protein 3 FlgL
MTSRITNSMLVTNLLADLQSVTGRLARTQQELSSGKQILKPSDDPFGTSRALALRADLAANRQYQNNVNDAFAWQSVTDTALGSIHDIVLRARDLVVQGASSPTGASGRQALAAEIDQLIESVKTAGNTQYAGQYVFAGAKTTTAPYAPGGADTYSGDNASLLREIGPGVHIPVNVTGAGVIGDGSTVGSLLATLRTISSDLKSNNISSLGTTDLAALDAASDNVSTVIASVGAGANRLQTALARLQQFEESSARLLSNTEDADMAKTLVDYSQQQAVYLAALKAGAQIIQPSLMDFLR